MSERFDLKLLKHLRRKHRSFISGLIVWSVIIGFVGLLVIALGFFLVRRYDDDLLKVLTTIGGTFIISLCSFPLKEILDRRGRINDIDFFIENCIGDVKDDHFSVFQTQNITFYNKILENI